MHFNDEFNQRLSKEYLLVFSLYACESDSQSRVQRLRRLSIQDGNGPRSTRVSTSPSLLHSSARRIPASSSYNSSVVYTDRVNLIPRDKIVFNGQPTWFRTLLLDHRIISWDAYIRVLNSAMKMLGGLLGVSVQRNRVAHSMAACRG